jgi:hypothetical protein
MKKPANTGAALKSRTASWQYDSMDLAAGMDNKDHPSYKQLSKFSGNPSKSAPGSPDSINAGRGALKGNTNPTGVGPKQPAASATGTAQYRGVGGTTVKTGKESFDCGRGPTRGNQQ